VSWWIRRTINYLTDLWREYWLLADAVSKWRAGGLELGTFGASSRPTSHAAVHMRYEVKEGSK
jgi:hypothetical protein